MTDTNNTILIATRDSSTVELPPSGKVRVFVGADGNWKSINSSGTVTAYAAGVSLGDIAAAITAHEAETDPHTQYLKIVDHIDNIAQYTSTSFFPSVGNIVLLYIAKDTNYIYRWDTGTTSYVQVGGSSGGGGAVSSVFGRTGSVTASSGDYTALQITNTPSGNVSSTTVQAAINELQTDIDSRALNSSLTAHVSDTANPHNTTKSQVGLSNVDNTSDMNKPVSTAQQAALDLKADIASPTFTGTVSGITKSMVGLSNVDNTSDTTKNSAIATLTNKTIDASLNTISNIDDTNIMAGASIDVTKLSFGVVTNTEFDYLNGVTSNIQTQINAKASTSDLTSHTSNTSNPHSVTKAQVGLSNVDNTSDVNKPISTATQTALNLKANLASPALTGIPTAPTASNSTNTTQLATTAFVQSVIASIPSANTRNVGGGGGYTSIATAIASCSSPSATNRYVINIEAGTYIEPQINVPSYIYIVGADERAVIIKPSGAHHVFGIYQPQVYISFLTISSAPTGYAAVDIQDADDYSLMHKVHVTDSYTGIQLNVTSGATTNTLFYTEYCDIEECENPLIVYSATGSYFGFMQNENLYIGNYLTPFSGTTGVLIHGNTEVVFNNGTIEDLYSPNTGDGITFYDGATVDITGTILNQWNKAIHAPATGSAPFITSRFVNCTNNTVDMNLQHPTLTGVVSAFADITKISIGATTGVMIDIIDPVNASQMTIGGLYLGDSFSASSNYSDAIRIQSSPGLMFGGDVTYSSSSLNITVATGEGYVLTGLATTDYLKYVKFAPQSISLTADSTTWIAIDSSGTLITGSSPYDFRTYIKLGAIITDSIGVIAYKNMRRVTSQEGANIDEMLRDIIKGSFKSGSLVTENGSTARTLNITAGEYYYGAVEYTPVGGTSVAMKGLYRNGSGGWLNNSVTAIASSASTWLYDNNSGTLVTVPSAQYVNYYVYLANDGVDEVYFMVYGQTTYATLLLAQNASVPAIPSWITENVVSIARVIALQGGTNTVQIDDLRPILGTGSASSSSGGTTDHLALTNLTTGNAGHTQFAMLNGSTTFTGQIKSSVTSNQIQIGASTNSLTLNGGTSASARTYTVPDVGASGNFAMLEGTQTISGVKTFSNAPILGSGSAHGVVTTDGSKNLVTKVLNNGQLLIGSTGNDPVIASLSGTTDRTVITTGSGTIQIDIDQKVIDSQIINALIFG